MKGKFYDFYILHKRKYKENSSLVSIFTGEFGKLSGIVRINKKQANLYQPLVKLRGEISFAKKSFSLNKIYNIELVKTFYKKSYISLLSLQYVNELIYLLLNYSHEEENLFRKYNFIIENVSDDNYKYLLRMFELELLESLGQKIDVEKDIDNNKIDVNMSYYILSNGFKLASKESNNVIKGLNLIKIKEPVYLWSEENLKANYKAIRVRLDNILSTRELKSRKFLVDYLNLRK